MRPLTLFLSLILVTPLAAQEDWTVLRPGKDDVPPAKMLYTYLQGEAQKQFEARRQAVANLKTPEDVARRQRELKAKFLDALGGFPEKTPLRPRVLGREQRDGYRVERVVYESRPEHHVTAAFYLPEGQGPFPGVLVPCGHSANGKAAEAYQRVCILLARNGFAVLCYDPIGQGERAQLLNAEGKPALAASTSEHSMVGVGALLLGRSTATYRIWDGIRSLDYLAGRPEVDPRRLGCTGNSGGGTLTAYLMALDERIAAAAPSCYITSLERLFATIGPQDAEQNIPGQVAFGLEHADYVTLRAPRPTLICVGTRDYFDIQGAWTTFREAKLLYGLLGHGERVDLFEYNDTHGFSRPRREAAARWLSRWLYHKDEAIVEGDFPVAKDEQLQVTRTGQVLEDFKGKSAFDLNAEESRRLASLRPRRERDALLAEVRRLTGWREPRAAAVKSLGEVDRPDRDYIVSKMVFTTEPGIEVPALLCRPRKAAASAPLALYLHGDGMARESGPSGAIAHLVKSGHRVLALDVRGTGETAPAKAAANRPNYFGVDSRESFLSQHLNRPLLGQRVFDVLSVVASLNRAEVADDVHELIGVGSAGPVALHAAALSTKIRKVTVDHSVASWSHVAQTPVSINQQANAVYGALKVYDLPDLASTVAPRCLTLRAATDAAGKPLPPAAVEEAYRACRAAYRQQGAEGQMKVQ